MGDRPGNPGRGRGICVLAGIRPHGFAKTGLPDFIRLALAWSEIGAAILFLIPRVMVAGGWLLIGVLVFAIVLHLLHGWFNVGPLVVYAVGTWAVMAGRAQMSAKN